MLAKPDPRADKETIRLLKKVDKLRNELNALEPQLSEACIEYGKRRGKFLFREWHVRNDVRGQITQ
jgi:hypothetical protein